MGRSLHEQRSRATRAAIFVAAHRIFMERGFDGAGIRDIAAEAGVNPAMVIRHFGSKERLFAETIDVRANWRALAEAPVEQLGRRMVAAILREREDMLPRFAVMVKASGRAEVLGVLRRTVEEAIEELVLPRLTGPDARLRAGLFIAQVFGLLCALALYEDEALRVADPEALVERYGSALQCLLTP
ncbi:MAG: TetR family transcriptional regulator [Pseudoclavibacter sp.]|nr:TetR family transcriptional regulator [Pseudoclavibacter sp.]